MQRRNLQVEYGRNHSGKSTEKREKYPVEQSYGSRAKYTELKGYPPCIYLILTH